MTFVFICRVCSKESPCNACACVYLNRSTAFPYHIVKDMKCPRGFEHHNWEYVKGSTLFIPVNFKSNLSQKSIKRSKCYLDKRRKCFYPNEHELCENGKKICKEMEPFRGEFHHLLKTFEWEKKHHGYVGEEHFEP